MKFFWNKIPAEYWWPSYDKWNAIVWLTENGEQFSNRGGFKGLAVIGGCTYCHYYFSRLFNSCYRCSLYKKNICSDRDKARKYKGRLFRSLFWQYIHKMNELKYVFAAVSIFPNFTEYTKEIRAEALELAKKIRDEIKKDMPMPK